MSKIGKNIKKYRELKGLTQAQLAEAIGKKSKNVISNWENGLNEPDPSTIELLLSVLGVDANTLMGWDNPDTLNEDANKLACTILSNPKVKEIIPVLDNLDDKDFEMVLNFIKRLGGD